MGKQAHARPGSRGSIELDGRLDEAAGAKSRPDGLRSKRAGRRGAADRSDGSQIRRRRQRAVCRRGCTRGADQSPWDAATRATRPSTPDFARSLPHRAPRLPSASPRRCPARSLLRTGDDGQRSGIQPGVAGADDGDAADGTQSCGPVLAAAVHRFERRRSGDERAALGPSRTRKSTGLISRTKNDGRRSSRLARDCRHQASRRLDCCRTWRARRVSAIPIRANPSQRGNLQGRLGLDARSASAPSDLEATVNPDFGR